MLYFPSALDHSQAASNLAWQSKARAAQWQLGLAALNVFDSSVLALLLDLRRTAAQEGATLTIHDAPAKLTQLATLYGVHELIA